MPRASRKAPDLEDPLEAYSTWDIRIAKVIFFGVILATAVIVLGIWAMIIGWLIEEGKWEIFLGLEWGYKIAIIAGAVTGHLFLLVLFYTLFRGGMVRLCQVLFKDRLVAQKWQDYYGLRMLVGAALLGLYITIISLIIGLLPTVFFKALKNAWDWMIDNFGAGEWILWIGAILFIIVGIVFFGFVLWNKGVFWVLKHVKEIEQEMEIEEQIKKEAIKNADERTLRDIYKKETGQKAIYRGKETRGYIDWKQKLGVK